MAQFDGATSSTDAGALLLHEMEQTRQIIARFGDYFSDGRDQRFVEHDIRSLLAQCIYGIYLGYEDINDHD